MIETISRPVYRSTAAGRCFLTKKGAIYAEAVALVKRKHPTEEGIVGDFGMVEDPGWHWTSLPRNDVRLRRLTRLIKAAMK